MKRYIVYIMVCFLISCSNKNEIPSGIIPRKEMAGILWDIIRAQALASEIALKDSSIDLESHTTMLTNKVFQIHNIARSDFSKSYDWYSGHPAVLRVMLDTLYTQKQRENDQIMRDQFKPKHDSLNRKILRHEQGLQRR